MMIKPSRIQGAIAFCTALMAITSAQASLILTDFGTDVSKAGWNVVGPGSTTLNNLVDTTDTATGISVTTLGFSPGANGNATTSPSGDAAIFAGVSNNSNYGNDVEFSGSTNPTPKVTFSGLNLAYTYDLTIFASRMGVSDIRSGTYTVTGQMPMDLNAANNTTEVLAFAGITPNGLGEIVIDMSVSSANTNSYGFIYLSATQLVEVVPEPSSAMSLLALLGGFAFLRRRRRNPR